MRTTKQGRKTQIVEGGGKEHHERVLQPMLVQPYLEEGCEGGVLLLSTKIKGGTPSGQNLTHVSFQLMEEQKAFSAPRKQPIKNSAVNVFRGPGSAEMAARCDGSIHVLALEVSWRLLCFRFWRHDSGKQQALCSSAWLFWLLFELFWPWLLSSWWSVIAPEHGSLQNGQEEDTIFSSHSFLLRMWLVGDYISSVNSTGWELMPIWDFLPIFLFFVVFILALTLIRIIDWSF